MKSNTTTTNNSIITSCQLKPTVTTTCTNFTTCTSTYTNSMMRMKHKKRRLVQQTVDETVIPLTTRSTRSTKGSGSILQSKSSTMIVNDSWCFDENNNQQQEENETVAVSSLSSSLPLLLLQRERGKHACNLLGTKTNSIRNSYHQIVDWQHRMLVKQKVETGTRTKSNNNANTNTNTNNNSSIWRKYCYKCIPFSQLNTPQSDAVLSLDTTGSYIISVGDGSNSTSSSTSTSTSTLVDDNDTQIQHQQHLNSTSSIEEPSLVVRLYGITTNTKKSSCNNIDNASTGSHSPIVVQNMPQHDKMISSPLIVTIPIAYKKIRNRTSTIIENEWSIHNSPPSPALFPIRILLSTDNTIGIVITRLWQHEGWTGCSNQVRIVVFPMPSSIIANNTTTTSSASASSIIETIVLDKIEVDRIGLSKPTNDANLLWIVNYCPMTTTYSLQDSYSFSTSTRTTGSQPVFHTIHYIPSYLFITDEEDGYHLHWFYFQYNNNTNQYSYEQQQNQYGTSTHNTSSDGWNYVSNMLVNLSSSSTSTVSFSTLDDINWDMPQWQYNYSHRLNGTKIQTTTKDQKRYGVSSSNNNNNKNSLQIGASAFLSIKAIVYDLMIRYPKIGNKQCIPKKFTFDIVSVLDNGRTMEIVLVFSSSSSSTTETETENVTGKRKNNKRKQDTSIGVFLLIDIFTQRYKEIKWQRSNVPIDEYDVEHINQLAFDRRCEVTGFASTSTSTADSYGNDNITYPSLLVSSLYPDCHSIDNVAVRKQRPVQSIKASNAPIELYYG